MFGILRFSSGRHWLPTWLNVAKDTVSSDVIGLNSSDEGPMKDFEHLFKRNSREIL